MKKISLIIAVCLISILALFLFKPFYHVVKNFSTAKPIIINPPLGFTNDASYLNLTKIDSLIQIDADSATAINELANLIRFASTNNKKISIAGSRHSMGGHTITPHGLIVDMKTFNRMHLYGDTLCVQAGALWSDVIPFLDDNGRSVAVMQSNNSFTVGGSISVNCHGWQHNSQPIASTVYSLLIMKADAELVTCSRTENKELFSLALGGYGLFGIIIEAKLKTVPNPTYELESMPLDSRQYTAMFDQFANRENVGMAYGRLDITPANFLNEAILNVFMKTDEKNKKLPLASSSMISLKRSIFRGSVGDAYGKTIRWKAEKYIGEFVAGKYFTRNQLLNEGVEVYGNLDSGSTDILHEYFIPKRNVNAFIQSIKSIIPKQSCDLLNITIRNVYPDSDSFLKYTREEVFGFVMLYNQPKTQQAELAMMQLTQHLIVAAVSLGGTYYLPYRLHATREQFYTAYPQAHEFFSAKLKYDPKEIFSNKFYEQYK